MTNETMIVDRVEDQGDRILIYRKEPPSRWGQYHVIAKAGDAAALTLKEGDTIVYNAKNGGINFGLFVGVAPSSTRMSSEEPRMDTTAQINQWQKATLKRLSTGGFRMYAPGENLKTLEKLGLVSLTRLRDGMSLTAVELTERGCEVATQLAKRSP